MNHLLSLLLTAILCATASAQTIKTLGFNTTNGQVVANTGTNVLTFVSSTNLQTFSPVKFRDWSTGQEMQIVLSDQGLATGYPATSGSIGVGGGRFEVNYGTANDWGIPLLFKYIESGVYETVSPSDVGSDTYRFARSISFNNTTNAAITRTNLGLPLSALTNDSNVTMMRALSGSTNTNQPYSGSISVVGTNNTNTLVFSNGILQSVQ